MADLRRLEIALWRKACRVSALTTPKVQARWHKVWQRTIGA